jgi:hypothetical protein
MNKPIALLPQGRWGLTLMSYQARSELAANRCRPLAFPRRCK